ncbi:MAG: ATP-binding protein [Spirochaetaceae bacterium]|jgi:predicted AAA+ superfamily ATPase|nr:ATP-binding protein [Spirochaetaceae bacterium]
MIHTAILAVYSLAVFSQVRKQPLIKAFIRLLKSLLLLPPGADAGKQTAILGRIALAWSDFTAIFAGAGCDTFYSAVCKIIQSDENAWTSNQCVHKNEHKIIFHFVSRDLEALRLLAGFDFSALAELVKPYAELSRIADECLLVNAPAAWEPFDFSPQALALLIQKEGAGIFHNKAMFYWRGALIPARRPDTVSLADLSGYTAERGLVIENTRRFLEGGVVNNMLLYGDRGTGKSATVKAVCNEFAPRGLRLIEVRKEDFKDIGKILDILEGRPLKFILFIDDLSFEKQDDSFTMLKALLEGGVEKQPSNIAVYATSNRRHFVKENFTDRPAGLSGNDVRAFDTMQEQLSLSDRFGITVIFTSPSQDEYFDIAESIAAKRGLFSRQDAISRESFRENAAKWERWFNGRSPRTACQFVDWIAAGKNFIWDE